jgi:hypothetical protein
MATACSCDEPLRNTGLPNCTSVLDIAKKLIIVRMADSTGTANAIDLTGSLDSAYFSGLINQSDETKRFFPTAGFDNATLERGDPTSEGLDSGVEVFVRQGDLDASVSFIKVDSAYAGTIDDWKCQTNFGVFIIDDSGRIIGDKTTADELRPLKVDQNTWNARYVWPTGSTVPKVLLNFSFDRAVSDGDLGYIAPGDLDNVDPLDFSGLLDINGTVVGTPTTTGFVMKITTDYGSALNPEPVTGLVLADFDLYNDTGAASVTPTSVTESPSGTYTFVIPSQTSGDDMTLTLASGVTGYDDTDLESATISIP